MQIHKTICECGMIVMGISENQLKSNLRVHKQGKKHKLIMQIKKEGVEKID